MPSASTSEVRYCVFVLPGGRRFNCNMASLQTSAPTASQLESSRACLPLHPVSTPTASAGVISAIAKARACLTRHGLLVTGGPVPPEGHGPGGPEGELVLAPALIAFYANAQIARRAEPEILRNTHEILRNTHAFDGEIDRRGAVTVLWIARPANGVRSIVQRCVFT